ncbi:MAG TPA: hypothetical protein VFI65_03880 [Streptosporangiaceae bacterium]|nr:hypothetical protein [Streptosporangiaceae bacterium]
MKRLVPAILAMSALAAGAAVGGAAPAAQAATAVGGWSKAVGVPGLAALNKGGQAEVTGVSCVTAGSCTAGGDYTGSHHGVQGFVADERHGRWGKAIEIPGLAALNVGGDAVVRPVACGSAGNCAVGGAYAYDQTGFRFSSFIATERGGRWSKAVSLDRDGGVYSISCASAGDCVAAGGATDSIGEYYLIGDAFVLQEQGGHWGSIKFIPGLQTLEGNGDPEIAGSWVTSVDCPSAGNCAAGGTYIDKDQKAHGFVAVETSGSWGTAIEVPGLTALSTSGNAQVNSVSCDSTGNCVAGGNYTGNSVQAFVAVETSGTWGTAIPVPGLAALNAGGNAQVTSMSCGAVSSCAATGSYLDGRQHKQGFVVSEHDGTWGKAIPVPGLALLNKGGTAGPDQISCGSAGHCTVAGAYFDRIRHTQGFVAVERSGVWSKAIPVPGLIALNTGGDAAATTVSCPARGACVAGGSYRDHSKHHQGFVAQGS